MRTTTGCLLFIAAAVWSGLAWHSLSKADENADFASLERQFHQLPKEARRVTGPLFWLHGDESAERLDAYLEKVAEGGNGSFTAESRPHRDWLGPGWYRDLEVCLTAARRLGLEMWIFDERWWPSGEVAGRVPRKFGSKYLESTAVSYRGPKPAEAVKVPESLVAVLAGRETDAGVDGKSLIDLTDQVRSGTLKWDVPEGRWSVMVFSWRSSEGRRGRYLVDGASRDAVDWYIRTVYQPHYDKFKADFGRTIVGYFYDEPETPGDWGTEVIPLLKARGVDWKKTLVAWKHRLAGEEQVAAKYQYQDALAEAWGRTLYGGLTQWCHDKGVRSIGHFLEHNWEYLHPQLCAGNMFQLQKYSDMGAIDAVFKQFVMGQRDMGLWQTPKLGSSISHVYGKRDDLAMVEIFGARGQDLTYPEMKWWTDHMHVSGINFHIPHSFNPRAPYDTDCPPYFYNGGFEPRWPLYRVYADYTSRLSLLLTGGRHVCPVALLHPGNSFHVGKAIKPEELTTVLQDALFDCDWMPYDVFEDDATSIVDRQLRLYQEAYQVLVVPGAEVVPYPTLQKAKSFLDAGGIVVGYGMLPSQSATLGKTSADIAALREAIWGPSPQPGLAVRRTNAAGGRSYFLPEKLSIKDVQQVFSRDAGVHPTCEVLQGETNHWLHVLHRVKAGRDVLLVCNQNDQGPARAFTFRIRARGEPECWDPMRDEITAVPYQRVNDDQVDVQLRLEPLESVLLVFSPKATQRPVRFDPGAAARGRSLVVTRDNRPPPANPVPSPKPEEIVLTGCAWFWHAEPEGGLAAPPGTRYFRAALTIPPDRKIASAHMRLTVDNDFVLFVNGKESGDGEDFMQATTFDIAERLQSGRNVLAVAAHNGGSGPNPAGLIGRYRVKLDNGQLLTGQVDATWKSSGREIQGWTAVDFDDRAWTQAQLVVPLGSKPWDRFDGSTAVTLSPAKANPFFGHVKVDALSAEQRVWLEADGIEPEGAAAVRINGRYAGGFIGRPYRLPVTSLLRAGENEIVIEPFAPATVRLIVGPP